MKNIHLFHQEMKFLRKMRGTEKNSNKQNMNKTKRRSKYKIQAVTFTFFISAIILICHSGFSVGFADPDESKETLSLIPKQQNEFEYHNIKLSFEYFNKETVDNPEASAEPSSEEDNLTDSVKEDVGTSTSFDYDLQYWDPDKTKKLSKDLLMDEPLLDEQDYEENIQLLGSGTAVATPSETKKTDIKVETAKAEAKNTDVLEMTYNSHMDIELSESEITILQRIVEAEATGEDIYGRMLVANVVLNRMHDDEFPDSIEGVVFQKGQFSPISDGRYYTVTITKKTKEAVKRVLSGEDYSEGALYFFARSKTSTKKARWFDNSLQRLFKYGGHEFYKEKG